MNLQKTYRTLKSVFDQFGLNFDISIEDSFVRATSSLSIKGYDDNIFAAFLFHESGICRYTFTFGKLSADPLALKLVNSFNENVFGFKAYITEFLRLEHSVVLMTDEQLAEYTESIFNELVDKETYNYLHPLSVLTTN